MPRDSPIAYFPFDEPPGTFEAKDIMAGLEATPKDGSPLFGVEGVSGTAVRFDGLGHFFLGDVLDLLGVSAYSVEYWVKPTLAEFRWHEVLTKRVTATDDGFATALQYVEAGLMQVGFEQSWPTGKRSLYAEMPPAPGFRHLAFTFEPNAGVHMYIDGVLHGLPTGPAEGGPADSSIPLRIGPGFVGTIDEIATYDYPLTAKQVFEHAGAGQRGR